ncbi:MAG: glycosyltransferase family 9 protein [Proteobacteria bacterium]|nr:glycosyltransferase family 9 protein [Pseudomonadota bacterium]MBU1299227.1 glycosyltransferase family 9 protein [Bacteroidota bacterium]MBU1569942.1 glycosyltransferase family 9 protein [Pseudomonadota bacterium]
MDKKIIKKLINFGSPLLLRLTKFVLPFLRAGGCSAPSIVVLKLAGMGDTVLMLPIIHLMRRTFPNYKIYAVVTPNTKPLFERCLDIDGIILYDPLGKDSGIFGFIRHLLNLRKYRPQIFIDFEHFYKITPFLAALSGAEIRMGLLHPNHDRGYLFNYPVGYDDRVQIIYVYYEIYASFCRLMGKHALPFEQVFQYQISLNNEAVKMVNDWKVRWIKHNKKLVGLHPGSGMTNVYRRWPLDNFRYLIKELLNTKNYQIVITGGVLERDLIRALAQDFDPSDVRYTDNEFNFSEFLALISVMDCFIANDSGPLHIGPWVGTKTIGLFGPETPERYGCIHLNSVNLYHPTPCSPCIQVHKGINPVCNNSIESACVRQIQVKEVFKEVLRLTEDVPFE